MSWTIPDMLDSTVSGKLEAAAKRAKEENILMFGSASDKGAHGSKKPYMSRMDSYGVICIGGAREAGYGADVSKEEGKFFFPGETNAIAHLLDTGTPNRSQNDKFGSSIATALASSFTAMLITLVQMCTLGPKEIIISKEELKRGLQSADNIRRIFRHINSDDQTDVQSQRSDKVIQVSNVIRETWGDSITAETEIEGKQEKLNSLVNDMLPRYVVWLNHKPSYLI